MRLLTDEDFARICQLHDDDGRDLFVAWVYLAVGMGCSNVDMRSQDCCRSNVS